MDRARHISRAIDTLPYIKSSQGVEFHPRVWSIIGGGGRAVEMICIWARALVEFACVIAEVKR